jgi:hypothetical protein
MTAKERKEYKKELKKMDEFAKKVSSNKKEAIRFLQAAGICTPSGKLTKIYS